MALKGSHNDANQYLGTETIQSNPKDMWNRLNKLKHHARPGPGMADA